MTDLIDTTEMYLRTILELEEEGIPPLRARIVERLEHSGPTVSQTVARMERDGLVHVGADRRLELTVAGRERAVSVLRKHRLAERLLADVIGLEWELVHEEACRWEHVMSDQVERRLLTLLENPTETPYGTPIPPRPEQASAEDWSRDMGLAGARLSEEAATAGRFRVRGLAEGVQTDPELLASCFRRSLEVAEQVGAVLEETSSLLVAKHGFAEEEMAAYRSKVLGRFANEALPDPVERVGRSPLRKLSREDRIIGPAAELAERGLGHEALLNSLSAALVFTPEGDEEVDRLQEILASADPDAATAEITGLEPSHPLYAEVRERIASPVYSRHTD